MSVPDCADCGVPIEDWEKSVAITPDFIVHTACLEATEQSWELFKKEMAADGHNIDDCEFLENYLERAVLMTPFWTEWTGSREGKISMLTHTFFSFRGYKLQMHKFVRPDLTTCFHTHPARAFRLILWGGYIEEVMHGSTEEGWFKIVLHKWGPGRFGIVRPEYKHRVHLLLNGRASYSLWFRFPKTDEIKIEGEC